MSQAKVRFDDAIPALARYITETAGLNPCDGVFLRDGFGRVAFYLNGSIPMKASRTFNRQLKELLGRTAFPTGALQDKNSPGASILSDPSSTKSHINVAGSEIEISLVDRRFYGRDWLIPPPSPAKGLAPILTVGSLKGGVGRTTALFVLAMELSRRGDNVLLVDLDLEAPGLASLVFGKGERPKYGVVDYLVENGLGGVDDIELSDFVATSRLTDRISGSGRVDLAPAAGATALDRPENMLAKLARALIEDPSESGPPVALASQISDFVTRLARHGGYDVILVDARSGLSELTAGPLLALGGFLTMFGTDHPHTFEGYRYLMAHLATLPIHKDDDWRDRLHFVHSMSSANPEDQARFDDKLFDVLADTFYEKDDGGEAYNFSLTDSAAPHRAWRIFFDGQFIGLDPISNPASLDERIYNAVFGDFIEHAIDLLKSPTRSVEVDG